MWGAAPADDDDEPVPWPPQPTITNVTSDLARAGDALMLVGSGFGEDPSAVRVMLGGRECRDPALCNRVCRPCGEEDRCDFDEMCMEDGFSKDKVWVGVSTAVGVSRNSSFVVLRCILWHRSSLHPRRLPSPSPVCFTQRGKRVGMRYPFVGYLIDVRPGRVPKKATVSLPNQSPVYRPVVLNVTCRACLLQVCLPICDGTEGSCPCDHECLPQRFELQSLAHSLVVNLCRPPDAG